MTERNSGEAWVCQDCYTAHHYGARMVNGQWFAGDADTPADRAPLAKLAGLNLFDNTCSDHNGSEGWDDALGENTCTHCGRDGYENGITEFSMSSCDGCGSTLGGSRYRLLWEET